MIILQKLKWGFYFSYGDNNEIDFTENVVTQILGVNGNGKSSIPLILEEMLFNKNSKGISKTDIPNRYVNNGCWGKLWFTKNEDSYFLEVDRKATSKIKLSKNGEDISSHTATNTFKTLESIIGTDFKTFSQLVYQNTNNSLQFLVATDTNRKKFLIDLLQLEEYVELFDKFKDAVKQTSSEVSSIEGSIQTIQRWIDTNSLEDLTEKPLIPVDDIDLSDDERLYAELSVKVSSIDKTNKSIIRNEESKRNLRDIDISEIQAEEVEPIKSYDSEQQSLGGLNSEKRRISTYISKLKTLSDTCPTCEQSIDSEFKSQLITKEEEQLESLNEQIEKLNTIIDRIKFNNTRYQHKQERIKEWENLYGSISHSLPSQLLDKESLTAEISNLAIKISNTREKLRKLTVANQEAAKHNSRVAVFIEQSDKFNNELVELQSKLEKTSEHLTSLEVLKKTFSTNGLVAYKIENLVKNLEIETNEYLAELSDGRFTIEFTVSNDKLNVIITDNGKQISITALSSGELARVNTSTLLALRRLMSSISKSEINVLFLDEVISVLDEAGREKLVEVLLKENLNTYVVSHSWSHPLLAKLEVVKENNLSRIEV